MFFVFLYVLKGAGSKTLQRRKSYNSFENICDSRGKWIRCEQLQLCNNTNGDSGRVVGRESSNLRHTRRPYIEFGIVLVSSAYFGSHAEQSTDNHVTFVLLRCQLHREPEVYNFHIPIARDKRVVRLDVAEDLVDAVKISKTL